MYDIDCIAWYGEFMGIEALEEINPFNELSFNYFKYDEAGFYRKIVNVNGFKEQFVNTFMDLINTNLSYGNVYKEMKNLGINDEKVNRFFKNRPEYMKQFISEEYGFRNETNRIRLEVNDKEQGNIKVNTCYPEFSGNMWEGEYFVDFPITIEANPYPGYEFAGWSGDVVSSNLSITVDMSRGDVDIKANFVKCGEK